MLHKRNYDSGFQKRKKKKKIDELIQSQRGALDKFIIKEPHVINENENENGNENHSNINIGLGDNDANQNENNDANQNENNDANQNEDNDANQNENNDANQNEDNEPISNANVDNAFDEITYHVDIFDPRNWDGLNSKMIDILVVKGPKRDLSIVKGVKDKFGRRFSALFYTRVLPNGEKIDRDWLVYSKELDCVFCFCCKFFKKGVGKGQLENDGYNNWAHLCVRIKEHETSIDHVQNMMTWYDLRSRLQKNVTIDKVTQMLLEKEKNHWKNVLLRIIAIVKFLGKHNQAFRGTNEKLFYHSNGNFLGLIEMCNEFDPFIQEHVRRITNDLTHVHYLGHKIQNELILLLTHKIKSEILKKVKEAKYFSVILDCTPDVSHQEQMSLILRYVDVSSRCVSIEESFLGFLKVNDTTGQGLFDVLIHELNSLDLDVDDVRGQSYDNGSNMKGKNQGVQRKLLDVNRRAFYTPCGAHSLNLMLCDVANSSKKGRDFFGVIQRIYTIFAKSTKKWEILMNNVKELTLKPLSSTRWESRVNSVKAIKDQLSDVREALLLVADYNDGDSSSQSEANSLAYNELGNFEFLVAIVIWYDLLSKVNLISKKLQSKDVLVCDAIESVKTLISSLKKYRENGFSKAIEAAKKTAIEMDIDPIFCQKRKIKRKKHFDETLDDELTQSPEESFKINFFYCIIDQAIVSLDRRFEQYEQYENVFGFLFSSEILQSLDESSLMSSCRHLEDALKNGEKCDINGEHLYVELKFLQDFLPYTVKLGALDILKYMKRADCFPNAMIVYRILLTIPVTVASAERSFSKLKLLKTYLRSSMSQERLNGLAMVAIENEILDKVDLEDLIDEFASKNARRKKLFK